MEESRTADPIGTETLYAVIGAIAEGPDLDRVLRAIVDLLVDATACHACFVYLREGRMLRIRAASPVFAHVVGRVALGIDEGLTGWVARNRRPAFIREAALEDPRMKYVPELEEDRFQSMVAVPLVDRHGDVIGVVVLHTQAPREFGQDVLDLLVHVASLVVGAIDNARLYDQTQRQVQALSALSDLGQELASLTTREQLYTAGCTGIARLLSAERCRLALYDEHGAAIDMAAFPADAADHEDPLLHGAAGGRLTAHMLDGGRAFGLIRVAREESFSGDDVRLLETATNQLALALRTAAQIEHLASENLVRQVFDALARGNPSVADARARAATWSPPSPHVALVCRRASATGSGWDDELSSRLEHRLRLLAPSALTDLDEAGLRALLPMPASDQGLLEQLKALGTETGVGLGISRPRRRLAEDATVLTEAEDAARVGLALHPDGGAWTYDELGAYRFLVELIGERPPDPAHARALAQLDAYDARRNASLLDTLEAYLNARGAVRLTAEALVIHPNTLRQRLERIEQLTGLSLAAEELLSLELSVKVHRLHRSNAALPS